MEVLGRKGRSRCAGESSCRHETVFGLLKLPGTLAMTAWTAADLKGAFERRVAGFDVRARPHALESEPTGLFGAKSIRINGCEWRPATIEASVWEREANSDQQERCNGLNLFPSLDLAQEVAGAGATSCVVAFDFPATLLNAISETFGLIRPLGTTPADWELLGFDVVDVRTQSSAFYSFDWGRREWLDLIALVGTEVNTFGLITGAQRAAELAMEFDRRVSAHAPFAPCGVWRQP